MEIIYKFFYFGFTIGGDQENNGNNQPPNIIDEGAFFSDLEDAGEDEGIYSIMYRNFSYGMDYWTQLVGEISTHMQPFTY